MQAEEIRKRKESEKMVRKGDDEPDWQNVSLKISIEAKSQLFFCKMTALCLDQLNYFILQELSTWKTRRRKQSEDAFQRVAEVKALEDSDSGEPRKM